ncbi:right-handed parallel beta-helix repeat-containing protein [Micromonospora sp. H33]|uniref:right-handed parallel beta-helix repeat-containing protein n=1 Tax=Micromonospora sp. H33 TaxID=3452215 RepID=UPI003F8A3256
MTLGGALAAPAAPAQADATVLYVNKAVAGCSDTGPGTVAQPYCTISAAVAKVGPGQTVEVTGYGYTERVTVRTSGTAERPITIVSTRPQVSPATLKGPTAGIVVQGQRHVVIKNFRIDGALEAPAIDLQDAGDITVEEIDVLATATSSQPAIRLAAVTGATLDTVYSGMSADAQQLTAGLTIDSASVGVTVLSSGIYNNGGGPESGVGIDVAGSKTTILHASVLGFGRAAILVRPGAADTVIANTRIERGVGDGIHVAGGTGTAISNNTVQNRCRNGIRVDGSPTRVSVQNNVIFDNGPNNNPSLCTPAVADTVAVGVYGDAVQDTVVDYNNTHHSQPAGYAWNSPPISLADFRTASGQGVHDIVTKDWLRQIDSANSAAPGFAATEMFGSHRVDDPAVANTGAGPIPFADRGPQEHLHNADPVPRLSVSIEPGTGVVTLDASASKPGWAPIVSYRFDFGDGTVVTQSGPVVRHRYEKYGTYYLEVVARDAAGRAGLNTGLVSTLPRVGTLGLLALANHRYVGVTSGGNSSDVLADRTSLGRAEAFDLMDAGAGRVALLSHSTGQYVEVISSRDEISPSSAYVNESHQFNMVHNADGSLGLKAAANNHYLSVRATDLRLSATASTIGVREKFHRVNVADANRSLQPAMLRRYVTADTAGTKPLAATSTTFGTAQRFDLVDLGNGQVAMFAHANRRFVLADGAGSKPLVARAAAVGSWERFTVARNSDGTVSLKAAVNSRYVTAGIGTTPLIASRMSIGRAERFLLR